MQKELIKLGVETQTPEMPAPYSPDYAEWKRVFEQFTVNAETTLIGHSCGAGFLLRWLSENKVKITKLILVAPYLGAKRSETFLVFPIDPTLAERTGAIHILVSDDEDEAGVIEAIPILTAALPQAKLHHFQNMGHFTYEDMKTEKFPALLALATT